MEWLVFPIAAALFVVVAPIVGLVRTARISRQLAELSERLALVEADLRRARSAPAPAARTEDEPSPAPAPERAGPWTRTAGPPEPGAPEEPPEPAAEERVEPAREPAAPTEAPAPTRSFEERFAASWMVWLGGITVALAAVFLFRYAIDQGWLTPFRRVAAGIVLGGFLLAGGEWTQRSPVRVGRGAVSPDYVPPALSAAGIFAIFVSLYAAHALYGLLGPLTAFVAMGLVSYSALALSLRQGWFVAALGILAGYLVPLLVVAPAANAVATFVYLYVLTLGALAVMVWRRWWWFSFFAIAGALGWPYLWLATSWSVSDQGALGLYLLALAATFGGLSTRLPIAEPEIPAWRWLAAVVSQSSGLGFALSGVLLLQLADAADYNAAAFAFVMVYGAIALALGLWRESLESLLLISAIAALALVLVWPQPFSASAPPEIREIGMTSDWNAYGPYAVPEEFRVFSRALWAFAALFGIGGFAGIRRVRARPVWAGVSALVPVLMFAAGYWRIAGLGLDVGWAFWAAGLAGLLLLAAAVVRRWPASIDRDIAVALYAAAVTAALALAFTCLLREAWLTVALAVEVAALGWVWSMLRVPQLKAIAVAVLAVVVIRLALNPMILDYRGGMLGMFGWVVYGYGLPAAATAVAARLFRSGDRDLTVTLCEAAAIGFAFAGVALQLKLWTSGTIYSPRFTFLDMAVQANWWILAGSLILHRRFAAGRRWAVPVGTAIVGAGAILVFAGLLVAKNPLFLHEPMGRWPVFNLLGLGYLVPALLFAALASGRSFEVMREMRSACWAMAAILVFADLTLEVRRAFHGASMSLTAGRFPDNAEIYAYSAAWIVFALALLGVGIVLRAQLPRYVSLAVLMLTVAKLFLYDMSDLTGLYRVASFLGLGLTLIGIGRLYRAFVFHPANEAGDPPPT